MFWLFTTSLIWAFSFGLIKTKLTAFDPIQLAFLRLALSFFVFLPFLRFKNTRVVPTLELMLIGAVQYGVMYVLYISAYSFLKAHEIALLTVLTPFYVVGVDYLLNKKAPWQFWLASLIAVIAGFVMTTGGEGEFSLKIPGILLLQGANLCFAIGQVFFRHVQRKHSQSVYGSYAWVYLGAVIVPAVILLSPKHHFNFELLSQMPTEQWITLLYLGIIPSGVCFYMWNYGASQVRSLGVLAVMNNLKVPFGVIISILVFQEEVNYNRLGISMALLALALLLSESERFSKSSEEYEL